MIEIFAALCAFLLGIFFLWAVVVQIKDWRNK